MNLTANSEITLLVEKPDQESAMELICWACANGDVGSFIQPDPLNQYDHKRVLIHTTLGRARACYEFISLKELSEYYEDSELAFQQISKIPGFVGTSVYGG